MGTVATDVETCVSRLLRTFALIWRLSSPYFRSEDRWAGRLLLAAVVCIELALVAIDVLINRWNNEFYNALQERNWDSFVYQLLYYCVLVAIFIVLAVYQLYLNQWLQIRWRRFMTERYLAHWLDNANHYRMQLLGDAADNPDQRIAEDIQKFVEQTLSIGIGLLSSIVTLGSFAVILWSLSNAAPLRLFGTDIAIPGYLVWAALVYSIGGTWLAHLIGRPLIGLNFFQQRYEADFRFNLVRVRENGEQIALLNGESAERSRLLGRFAFVITNFLAIMDRQKKLRAFTAGYDRVAVVFPFLVVGPAYFNSSIQLGALMQTASAFGSVQGALSFIVTAYRQIAEWRAVVQRLEGFEAAVATGQRAAATAPMIEVCRVPADELSIENIDLRLPTGTALAAVDKLTVAPHEHVLVNGPSGAGKSTMFRAVAGIWPFGAGKVSLPRDAHVMVLPQRPYLPIGTLHAAVVYPALPDHFDVPKVREILTAVGLPALAQRLEEEAHWNRMLSLGEQQRLGLARAVLHAPDYLFLDEATASLDEPSEARLYKLLGDRLPGTAIISIGHRSTLAAFHRRFVELRQDGDRFRLRETAAAAE
jgi:putative ATP-binding cassette transporter